jgi:integrase
MGKLALNQNQKNELAAAPPEIKKWLLNLISARTTPETKADYSKYIADFNQYSYQIPCEAWQIAEYFKKRIDDQITKTGESYKISTLKKWLAALSKAHQATGHPDPTKSFLISEMMAGLNVVYGKPPKKAKTLTRKQIEQMLHTTTDNPIKDLRDKTLIAVGFGSGCRSDELANMRWEHIEPTEKAGEFIITIPQHKTVKKVGALRKLIPPKIGYILKEWHKESEGLGFVFKSIDRHGNLGSSLSKQAIYEIIKDRARLAGIPFWNQVSSHSLRISFINLAIAAGFSIPDIGKQTGQTPDTVLRYMVETDLLVNNPVNKIF